MIADVNVRLEMTTVSALDEATAAVASLNTDPNSHLAGVAGALLRSESVGSSKIEQLSVDARSLALAAIGEVRARSSAAQVWANVAAMEAAIRLGDETEFSEATIASIHFVLMKDDPYERSRAGKMRETQNWICGSDECPRGALHVPPAVERLAALMSDLTHFATRLDIPPIAQAAIAHAQFETIHPFTDGNGRTGRALIHTILRRRGLARTVVVPTSSALLTDVSAYFASLGAFRNGDLDEYLTHFAFATARAAQHARTLGADLQALSAEWNALISPRAGSVAAQLLGSLIRQPVISANRNDVVGADPATVYRAIDRLVSAGVLSEITASKRNRIWVAKEVTAALDEFSRRIGQRFDGR